MIRFVIESFIFKKLLTATVIFLVLLWVSNKAFDAIWDSSNCIALTNMNDVYKPPVEYDNTVKIYMLFVNPDKLIIEGNKRLRIAGSSKVFGFFDTAAVRFPKDSFEVENKIFLEFEGSKHLDSIYFVISKSGEEGVYFKQIFLSTVDVKGINSFSKNKELFRIDTTKLVSAALLENNDTLINSALSYFNRNMDTLKLGDCAKNSNTFWEICRMFNLPCRLLYLQGGNLDQSGFNNRIGYPSHEVCEVYSSLYKTWYVIDPTYGLRFRDAGSNDYLSAAEISNNFFFMNEKHMVQDSILFTKRTLVDRDYFKYYENVHYEYDFGLNVLTIKILQKFYSSFSYSILLYANDTTSDKNGKNYLILKSIMYIVLLALHLNYALFIIAIRLVKVKKPQK